MRTASVPRLTFPAVLAALTLVCASSASAATPAPYRLSYYYDHNDYATDGHGHVISGNTLLRYGHLYKEQVIVHGKVLPKVDVLRKVRLTEEGEIPAASYQVMCTAEITPDINCQGDTNRQGYPIPLPEPYLDTITPARLSLAFRTARNVRLLRVRITHGDLHVRRPDGTWLNLPGLDHNVRCQSRHFCRVTLTNATTDWVAHNVRVPETGQVVADYPVHRVVTFEGVSVEAAPERR